MLFPVGTCLGFRINGKPFSLKSAANSSRESTTKVAIVALKGAGISPIRKVIKSSLLKQFPNSFRDM
ncbi:hypothetical protein BLGI_956 [Brevibacillus laterosporus GI-9]|nr:hypothetical protein BLGI_956 [Brevibacillus laterosporus GI-9]